MVVGVSQQESLDLGFVLLDTHQQDVSVILMDLMLPDGLDPASSNLTVRDVTTEQSGPRLTSCRTNMFHTHQVINSHEY
ncbi:unnamed protein product [Schistosoma mattheei]|uniref:Uncharacterized protein n=1 Tax=Schistosoma mattheei TaxID=31246 RepID=A0A183NW96_9TREM|nr:unnamed protein product [Schistosoma mattheei]